MTDIPAATHRAIPGLCGPIPRLVLGSVNLSDERPEPGFAVLDAFVERGGRLVDTALVYGGGAAERLIGLWLRARSAAAREVLILTKGAHPDEAWRSRLTPEAIAVDIAASLGRLDVGTVDAWLVHRDDEAVPVGEIVDALDTLVRTGQARAVGVSNWRLPRLREAVGWAAAHGRAPIVVSSSYLGAGRMATELPWLGCVSARDDKTLALARHDRPIDRAWVALETPLTPGERAWLDTGDGAAAS